MSVIKLNILGFLLNIIILLFAGNVIADKHSHGQKKHYKVDFNNPQSKQDSLNTTHSSNTDDFADLELKVLFFGERHILSIDPGTIKNTKTEYGNTENVTPSNATEIEK